MWNHLNSNQYYQEEKEKPEYSIKRKIKLQSKESRIERVRFTVIELRNSRKSVGQENI